MWRIYEKNKNFNILYWYTTDYHQNEMKLLHPTAYQVIWSLHGYLQWNCCSLLHIRSHSTPCFHKNGSRWETTYHIPIKTSIKFTAKLIKQEVYTSSEITKKCMEIVVIPPATIYWTLLRFLFGCFVSSAELHPNKMFLFSIVSRCLPARYHANIHQQAVITTSTHNNW